MKQLLSLSSPRLRAIKSLAIMGLAKKAYPKATLKKIIKAHSNHNLKKNADVTVRSFRCKRVSPLASLTRSNRSI